MSDFPDLSFFLPQLEASVASDMEGFGHRSPAMIKKVAREFIDLERIREQYGLLARFAGDLGGKSILEVGSGYGLFTAYGNRCLGCRVTGIEPSPEEYASTYHFSKELLRYAGLDPGLVVQGCGENIPFPDNSFDIVYSSNVLEHVMDPQKVLRESIRVLKPGGLLQMVVPNYGSLWEGHYCIPWIPYLPHPMASVYVRFFGKDPKALKGIRFIHYFWLRRILKASLMEKKIKILSWGEEIFRERMLSMGFSEWAGLAAVKAWVRLAHRLRLIGLATRILLGLKAQTPLILTLRKT